jgi:hypothetical protein
MIVVAATTSAISFAERRTGMMTVATLERVTRIELAYAAWEAAVLPLNYTRVARIVDGRYDASDLCRDKPADGLQAIGVWKASSMLDEAPSKLEGAASVLQRYSICSGANGDSSFNDHFSIVPAPGSS